MSLDVKAGMLLRETKLWRIVISHNCQGGLANKRIAIVQYLLIRAWFGKGTWKFGSLR